MKKRFRSYADAEVAFEAADKAATLTSIALNAVLSDKVEATLTRGDYTARIVRANGPAGGYILLTFHPGRQSPHTAVYLYEDYSRWRSYATANDADGLAYWNLQCDVSNEVMRLRSAAELAVSA